MSRSRYGSTYPASGNRLAANAYAVAGWQRQAVGATILWRPGSEPAQIFLLQKKGLRLSGEGDLHPANLFEDAAGRCSSG
jgi:hypothetical protein